ncbi:MAG: CoA transferase [Lautropia sp.]|nr:CoA transferase [Lautropia sp.]
MQDPAAAGPDAPDDSVRLPLEGLQVTELHAIGPVPFAGMLLTQLGARVTRVSPPQDPGLGVAVPPEFDLLNHGKTTLALDLKNPRDQWAMAQQLAGADVLLEGFRPGVLERLGLHPQVLLRTHPRLVVGRLSGWGDRGPLAMRAGHDINYLALTGVLHAIGKAGQPVPPLNLVADFGGGAMHLLVGVLARLVRRGLDGRGGVVTTSIAAGTVGLTPMFHGLLAAGQWRLQREANLLDGGAPFYRTYACADGGFVAVGALEPKFYRELLDATGLAGRLQAADQYLRETWADAGAILAARFLERGRDDWAEAASGRDCCLSPVLDFTEAAAHPHLRANGWFDQAASGDGASSGIARPLPVLRFDGGS